MVSSRLCLFPSPKADHGHRKHLDQIRRNAGPFTDPEATTEEFLSQFEKFKILYVSLRDRWESYG